MVANYPGSLPSSSPATHQAVNDEVVALGTELGTLAKGGNASVKARLQALDDKARFDRPKYLIKHGQDIMVPSQVAANATLIDSRPFDGWVINITASDFLIDPTASYSQATLETALSPMPILLNATHNWLIVRWVATTYDWFNNTHWTNISSNMQNLAAAMVASGKQWDGIMIDPEYYGAGTSPWDYGTTTTPWTFSSTLGATPNVTAVNARTQVQARGKQVMDAIAVGWPTAKVMVLYGGWVAESYTFTTALAAMGPNDVAWSNELLGSFNVGLAESTFTNLATYIDGGESYRQRISAEFRLLYDWQKEGWTYYNSSVLASGLRADYRRVVNAATGVYDKDIRVGGLPLTQPANFQNWITWALESGCDDYVWLYTEYHEWGASNSGKPAVTQDWLDAAASARSKTPSAPMSLAIDADITTTSTSAVDIVELTFANVPIGTYILYASLFDQSSLTTAGPRFAVGGNGATATVIGAVDQPTSATARTQTIMTAAGTLYGTNVGATATTYRAELNVQVKVTVAGHVPVRWAVSAAATGTLKAGSYAQLTRVA